MLNQPPPLAGYDLYEADPVLAEAVRREGAGWASERLLALTELTGQSEAGLEDLFDDAFYLHLLAATGTGELDPEEVAGEGSIVRRVERVTGHGRSPLDAALDPGQEHLGGGAQPVVQRLHQLDHGLGGPVGQDMPVLDAVQVADLTVVDDP